MNHDYRFHNLTDLTASHFYIEPAVRVYPGATSVLKKIHHVIDERTLSYRMFVHFHPYATQLVRRLIERSVRGLQAYDTEYRYPDGRLSGTPDPGTQPVLYADLFSVTQYNPSSLVNTPYPVKDLDFNSDGAYSVYNWELFYHIPLTLAIHLSKNQRFEDAMHWFHYIFDPTDSSPGATPERFWKVKPFQKKQITQIEELLVNLSTNADPDLRERTMSSIGAWRAAPFRPHVVARYRHSAYMFKTVFAYLDNLIEWGDSLFRQDTGEAIDEARQLYVLAASILGPRPQAVPRKGTLQPQTYASLRNELDAFGNALRQLEVDVPFNLDVQPDNSIISNDQVASLRSMGKTLYFCVPRNDYLMRYWDIVADRLFKIRNSLNLQGVFRQLPLFEPPIDPAMLARATTAGLPVSAIISGLNQPLPLVRFGLLIQKATELCQEVKSLGSNLLSVLEKEDNEALATLRASHEVNVLTLARTVKYQQWQDALKSREALLETLKNATQRYQYYERLLGNKNPIVPEMVALIEDGLVAQNYSSVEPSIVPRPPLIDIAEDTTGEGRGTLMSTPEVRELEALKEARAKQADASLKDRIGAGLSLIPDFTPDIKFWGIGVGFSFGGSLLSRGMSFWGNFSRAEGDALTYQAGSRAKTATYERREQDWTFQSASAAGEINLVYKQLRAAQIRESAAKLEWQNHQIQIDNAKAIEQFLKDEKKGKLTRQSFYTWMKREVKGLYGQCFQLAFDVAKKAERALQQELGDPGLTYLQFGYLGGREGLLAGERLLLDIKRMEMAYHELNSREYELSKDISLMRLSPDALLQLRTTGSCSITLPEALFDLDGAGHYFRRIKTVSVSIPAVTGPHVGVNLTLTLNRSSVRTSSLLLDGEYARQGSEDPRFNDYFGQVHSIVTSTGRSDSGLFETNLRDERPLPFEGSGAISDWSLRLPAEVRQFDYATITDVILHVRYTAREGGMLLRNAAVTELKQLLSEANAYGSVRLFSVRHEFNTVWSRFKNAVNPNTPAEVRLTFRPEHYPYWSYPYLEAVKGIEIYALTTTDTLQVSNSPVEPTEVDALKTQAEFGADRLLRGALDNITKPEKPADDVDPDKATLTLFVPPNGVQDLWVALTWGAKES